MWRDISRIFEELDKEFAEAEEMINRLFRTVRRGEPFSITEGPYYYGFQITIDEQGRPHIREFGNIRPSSRGLVEPTGVREPLVDTVIDEKENVLKITAEMPGINKEDIKVRVGEDFVEISAERGDRKYHTEIPLTVKVDEEGAKATYVNGILELKLKLKEPAKKAKEVKVE
ncbi:MAG: Hsp20/alpha crystallin family protein [Candidatus Nitrosothermus koennekii]|nr:MAG: Hsp20/alpha crystallin family protein [Candidatus Nitrosothermus koennekii]